MITKYKYVSANLYFLSSHTKSNKWFQPKKTIYTKLCWRKFSVHLRKGSYERVWDLRQQLMRIAQNPWGISMVTLTAPLTVKNCCRVVGPNRVPFCADVLQVLARAMNQPLRHLWCLLHHSFLLLTAVPGEPGGGLSDDTHTHKQRTPCYFFYYIQRQKDMRLQDSKCQRLSLTGCHLCCLYPFHKGQDTFHTEM